MKRPEPKMQLMIEKGVRRLRLAKDCAFGPSSPPRLKPLPKEKVHRLYGADYMLRAEAVGLRFLHIGKCGGTTIIHDFFSRGVLLTQDHMRPPAHCGGWVFVWIRHPASRFTSAFYHSKSVLDFDLNGIDADVLTHHNCPAPQRVLDRLKKGYAFHPEYDRLVGLFESCNAFLESLTSSNQALRESAEALLNRPEEHIMRGIGYHLNGGHWVKPNARRLLMVGKLESITQDYARLQELLGWDAFDGQTPSHKRSTAKKYDTALSKRARETLKGILEKTEYPALEALVKSKHLSREDLDRFMTV